MTRDLCYRLIGEAKQQLQAQAPAGGASGSSRAAAGRVSTPEKAAGPGSRAAAAAGSGQPPSRAPGFITHLLQCDSKVLGRPLTDVEVSGLPFRTSIQRCCSCVNMSPLVQQV